MTRNIRLAVVMDPIAAIKYAKDSTLAMLLAAQSRGFELHYLEQQDLFLRDGRAMGHARPLPCGPILRPGSPWASAVPNPWAASAASSCARIPPFDMEFIYTTYILDRHRSRARWW
ncbi:MAG: hypothetical protein WDM77_09415 [Steroidobacteraceae bacterium]